MRTLLLAASAMFFTACSQLQVSNYRDTPIQFDPTRFFNNDLIAEGIVMNRRGEVTRYFTATIKATWNEQGGVLDEVFQWSDGEVQTRVWRFSANADGSYTGTAGDVIGDATMVYAGNAINMDYRLDVPLSNGNSIAINMDDWLYQVSDRTLVNVTEMKKFGFRVGRVVLSMRVVDEPGS